MSESPTVAIMGTGALGGYYGARLAQSGLELHFLCHRDAEHIKSKGLVMESVDRSIMNVRAHAYSSAREMPRCDVVIVSLKTTANHLLPDLLPPVIKPQGVIVVMQNGWDVERDAAAAAPGMLVLGGLSFLCANKVSPGYIQHLDYGNVLLGWHKETGTKESADHWINKVYTCLNKAQVQTEISPDLGLARWKKLVWNIPYNGLSVIYRTTTDVLMADPVHCREVEALMREVQMIAAADGHPIEDDFILKMMNDTRKMRPYKTSMLLDFESGKPMEIESMYERPFRVGSQHGIQTPHIEEVMKKLKALQR